MAAKKSSDSTKTTLSKSAFVRSLPASMPAKEVSTKAKAAGLVISDRYVYVIRSIAKRAGKGGSSKSAAAGGGGRPVSSKRAFVMGLPADVPAAEVIKRAKAAGMKLSTNYVYKLRSRGAASAPAGVARRGRPPKSAAVSSSAAGSHEQHFLTLVLEVGLTRAAHLLEQVREKLHSL